MMNFESDERNLPQKISEDIISFILNEHLQPGDKLPNEAHLAKELNIGRSSLREAMKLLASRNIVTIRQGSGTYVASSPGVVDDPLGFTFIPDKKKLVQDLLEVRFLLEPAIAAMSATYADNNDIKKIVSLCDEVEYKLDQAGISVSHIEGYRSNSWILLDYIDVIVNVFDDEARDFYDLERLWQDGESVDLTGIVD